MASPPTVTSVTKCGIFSRLSRSWQFVAFLVITLFRAPDPSVFSEMSFSFQNPQFGPIAVYTIHFFERKVIEVSIWAIYSIYTFCVWNIRALCTICRLITLDNHGPNSIWRIFEWHMQKTFISCRFVVLLFPINCFMWTSGGVTPHQQLQWLNNVYSLNS